MSEVQKVNLIDEQKNTKETIQVSTVGSYEFENTELTGLWVDSHTGNLEVYIKDQPQLTIPKSIADALDVGDLMFLAWTHGNDLLGKVSDEERNAECRRRNAIAKAYLAGKALGVDLVKVVEG